MEIIGETRAFSFGKEWRVAVLMTSQCRNSRHQPKQSSVPQEFLGPPGPQRITLRNNCGSHRTVGELGIVTVAVQARAAPLYLAHILHGVD